MVKSIMERYNRELPRKISDDKINKYVKEAGKIVGILGTEEKPITKGGERRIIIKERYQMISSHTGRRSLATNLYKSGFPSISIMKITGHRSEKAFLKYIKVTPEEHAELLEKHWEKLNQIAEL